MHFIPYVLLAFGLISMVFCRIAIVRQTQLNISDRNILMKIDVWKTLTYIVLGLSIISALYFNI
jgi:hypothetical protein